MPHYCDVCDSVMYEGPGITPGSIGSFWCPYLKNPKHQLAAAAGKRIKMSVHDRIRSFQEIEAEGQRKMAEDMAARQIYKGGAAATKIPGFKYIPLVALERLAQRFELGLARHGANSWNALNPESAAMLDDKEWLIERLSHVIHHAYKEIERLTHESPLAESDDNAAAIMWGGACLIAADERRKSNAEQAGKASPEKRDR